MIKVVCISDTHCRMKDVNLPDGDILIHAGDLTFQGTIAEVGKELNALKEKGKKFKTIIFVAGNHDWLGERNPSLMKQMCKDNGITYLQDDYVIVEGKVIYGSPWQPEFCDWAFNLPRGQALKEKWEMIPDDVDILITHGPVKNILDLCPDGFKAGCEELFYRVQQIKPELHVCGHIHHSYGVAQFNGTTFVNASICDEQYKPINKPIEIELE